MTRRPRGAASVLTIGAAVALALGACSEGDRSAPARPDPTTTTSRAPVPIAPLTGLPDPAGVANGRAALGVKIENTPEARPQSGLDEADLVYEEVVEGGITRFWAFFSSRAPAVVGPIRSVRPMDPDIILPLGGIVAFSGGTPENVALVRATGLVTVDEGNAGDAFFREPTRQAPHNLYGRTARLWGLGATAAPPPPMFSYRSGPSDPSTTAEPVASFHVGFQAGYDVTYAWDERRGAWLRYSQQAEPFLAASPRPVQVAPANVVVELISYARGADGEVTGAGQALVFTDGGLIRGTWAKASPAEPTRYLDAAGAPIALTPGPTWVELAPVGTLVDVVAPAPPTPTTAPAPT